MLCCIMAPRQNPAPLFCTSHECEGELVSVGSQNSAWRRHSILNHVLISTTFSIIYKVLDLIFLGQNLLPIFFFFLPKIEALVFFPVLYLGDLLNVGLWWVYTVWFWPVPDKAEQREKNILTNKTLPISSVVAPKWWSFITSHHVTATTTC